VAQREIPWQRGRVVAAFCALLLLAASAWPTLADDTKPLTAILLVAKAQLDDPDFSDSVVLTMNNLGPAPIGIIVNRPTQLPVSQLFPDLKRLAPLPDKVYFGGPVELRRVWFLFRAATPPGSAIKALDGVYLSADRELLLRLLGRDKPMDGLRVFVGHAGWGPGQLQAEIARGDWSLERAAPEAIFHNKSEHAWPAPSAPKNGT
jgi:putative transcriptional regulator